MHTNKHLYVFVCVQTQENQSLSQQHTGHTGCNTPAGAQHHHTLQGHTIPDTKPHGICNSLNVVWHGTGFNVSILCFESWKKKKKQVKKCTLFILYILHFDSLSWILTVTSTKIKSIVQCAGRGIMFVLRQYLLHKIYCGKNILQSAYNQKNTWNTGNIQTHTNPHNSLAAKDIPQHNIHSASLPQCWLPSLLQRHWHHHDLGGWQVSKTDEGDVITEKATHLQKSEWHQQTEKIDVLQGWGWHTDRWAWYIYRQSDMYTDRGDMFAYRNGWQVYSHTHTPRQSGKMKIIPNQIQVGSFEQFLKDEIEGFIFVGTLIF